MTIEEILAYLRINPDDNETVLYRMLDDLYQAGYDRGYSDSQESNQTNRLIRN